LRPDLLDLVRHGVSRGMLMHINTNGSLVNAEVARDFADAGVASVNVSLDGPDAETHDRLRGRRGSFERVLRAVAHLVAVPRRPYRVALTCALGETNAGDAERLLERARDIGADRVGFLPVHEFPANRVQPANGRTERHLTALLDRCGRDPLIDNSRDYLALFERAYRSEPNPVPCLAPRTSLVVDCYGDVYPCVPLNASREPVGSGDVRQLWRSRAYRQLRESLRDCRACYWNCHTELNLALRRLGAGS
jgi:MoaA/NifB/PqqE/SkfB family radical SAM enzyme